MQDSSFKALTSPVIAEGLASWALATKCQIMTANPPVKLLFPRCPVGEALPQFRIQSSVNPEVCSKTFKFPEGPCLDASDPALGQAHDSAFISLPATAGPGPHFE